MATVRFSKELCDAIVAAANRSFEKRIQELSVFNPTSVTADLIYETTFGEHIATMKSLPVGYMQTTRKFHIINLGTMRINKEFAFTAERPWPFHITNNNVLRPYNGYSSLAFSHDAVADHPVWQPLIQEANTWSMRLKAESAKRDEFVKAVKEIIGAYSTLAPALKAWPPLWDLIPENYKDKHREVVDREKKPGASLNVDLNRLTALAAQAKFQR